MRRQYQDLKNQAVEERNNELRKQMNIVEQSIRKLQITNQRMLQISSLSVQMLVNKLNSGQITSEAITASLCYRSFDKGARLNFYTVTNFSYAIGAAIQCDKRRKSQGKKNWVPGDGQYDEKKFFPALFGIPVSVKDVFHVDGLTTTLGLISKALNKEKQSPMIFCLKNAGAIPFIKTNVPQFGMSMETSNNLWGRTVNPWNTSKSVGGSSGGQGAIIAAKCSVLGIGSDIGGSIRIPAEHCGVFGIKPYSKRISSQYHAVFSKAFVSFGKTIPLCIGPLARSAIDLALFMDVVTTQQFYKGSEDSYTKIIPFDWKAYKQTQQSKKKYRVGYIKSLTDIEPSKASSRAITETIELLRQDGHEMVEIKLPNEKKIIKQFIGQFGSCKAENFRQILAGEDYIPEYKLVFQIGQMWSLTRFLVSTYAKWFQPRAYDYFLQRKPYSEVMQYQTHVGEISSLKDSWIDYWRQQKLDFVIAPGFGCQAMPHGKSDQVALTGAYSFIWNVLDMVSGSMPITIVRDNQLLYESAFNDMLTAEIRQVAQSSQGLPVGIQVVGLPYEEEKVLGFMSYLERKVKFSEKHPYPEA